MNAPRELELVNVGDLERGSYLGGDDIAALMGVNPYRTPLDVYLRKTGQAERGPPDPEREKRFRRGKLMEPVVLEMMRQDFGIEVVAANHRYRDPEFPFLAAEIDFEWHDADSTIRNGEIKTVHPFGAFKWGEAGTEEVPIEYAAQSMFGLMITGRAVCQYGVLFGSDNLVLYHVLRDDETIAAMRELAVAFWNDHVLARVPPAPRTAEDLHKLWPKPTRNAIVATPEVEALLAEHAAIGREMDERGKRRDELAYQIGEFVKDFDTVTTPAGGWPIATYKAQSRETLDSKGIKAAHPDIYRQYVRATDFRVLRHHTPKGVGNHG